MAVIGLILLLFVFLPVMCSMQSHHSEFMDGKTHQITFPESFK